MFQYWIKSLSARLWITSVAGLALTLIVIFGILFYRFDHSPPESFRVEEIKRLGHRIAAGLYFDDSGRVIAVKADQSTMWIFNAAPAELKYRVLDQSGQVVLASPSRPSDAQWAVGKFKPAASTDGHMTLAGRRFNLVTLEVHHGAAVFYVQSAASEEFFNAVFDEKFNSIPGTVGFTLLIAVVTFGLTLTFTVRRVLRPLRDASDAAALITPQNLRTRLSIKGLPSEIKPLLTAFNEALARLENGFAVQQQFLASAAHELQTPLTLIRGQVELQPEIEHKELLFREIDLMGRQVRQLLHLAEVSELQNFNFTNVDRIAVAEDVADYLARKADRKEVKLQVEGAVGAAALRADKSALFILLKNIVENAINATPPLGSVKISVGHKTIRIRDQGCGVNPDYMPFLFERFWRAPDATHEGAGLGLAICREIALAHKWQLTVNRLRSGTQFTVWF